MNNPRQAPNPSQFHLCFSGSLHCSGCNPCPACHEHVRACVLPVAMGAAGFDGNHQQAQAFFNGYAAGWQRLQEAMSQNQQLQAEIRFVDVAEIAAKLDEYEQMKAQMQQAGQTYHAQAQAVAPYGQQPYGGMPGQPPMQYTPPPYGPQNPPNPYAPQQPTLNASQFEVERQPAASPIQAPAQVPVSAPTPPRVTKAQIDAQAASREQQRVQNLAQPVEMEAEEIVRAAVPASSVGSSVNGRIALGNVMVVPPGMEDHLPKES